MDFIIIAGPEYHKSVGDVLIEFIETNNIKFRRTSKTEIMAQDFQLTAIREDLYEIEVQERLVHKQTWNKNRQRNLRHYPGRRWIDLRTMNK